jgi:iron(III) transport system permease protein
MALLPPGFVVAVGIDTGWETIKARWCFVRASGAAQQYAVAEALTVPACIALRDGRWLTERTTLAGRQLWSALAVAPLAIPAFVQSYALGQRGAIMHGLSSGVFLSVLAYYPFIYMPVAAVLAPPGSDAGRCCRLAGHAAVEGFSAWCYRS